MTELEKIAYAKSFIDKLAGGINPLDDTPIPNDDIVNNVRLSRCFFYVSDILRQVIEAGGTSPSIKSKARKKEFSLTQAERSQLHISELPLTVGEISTYLNSIVDVDTTKRLSVESINSWLIDLGFLTIITSLDGKNRKRPTEQGNNIGIFTEERPGKYGTYEAVVLSPEAQQFIYDNIQAIVEAKKSKKLPFSITREQLGQFEYSSMPISVSAMGKKINWLVKNDIQAMRMEEFSYRKINYWLRDIGMIEWREWTDGKAKRFPTAEGEEVGLVLQIWGKHGRQSPVIYLSEKAQHFIIDNIEAVIAAEKGTVEEHLKESPRD